MEDYGQCLPGCKSSQNAGWYHLFSLVAEVMDRDTLGQVYTRGSQHFFRTPSSYVFSFSSMLPILCLHSTALNLLPFMLICPLTIWGLRLAISSPKSFSYSSSFHSSTISTKGSREGSSTVSHLHTVLSCLLRDSLSQSRTDLALNTFDQDLLDQHAADLVHCLLLPGLVKGVVGFVFRELGEKNAMFGMLTVDVVDDDGGCCVNLLLDEFAQVVAKRIDGGSWIRAGRAGKRMLVEGKTRRGEIGTVLFLWLRRWVRLLLSFVLSVACVGW